MSVELDATTYVHAKPTTAHSYILPAVLDVLESHFDGALENDVFDLGCGTGGAAAALAGKGYYVVGVDPSSDGIAKANVNYPELPLNVGSAYDKLSREYGTFNAVISLEAMPSSAWRSSSMSTIRRLSPRRCTISSSRAVSP